MSRNCAYCGNTKFGLIHYKLLTFNGYLIFCTRKCKEDFAKAQQEEIRKQQFLRFLYKEKSRN